MNVTMNAIWTNGHEPKYGQTLRLFSPKNIWIKVAYAGLCRTDILCGKGQLDVKPNRILGHELSGLVYYSPIDRLKKNDRVVVNPVIFCGACRPCLDKQPCLNLKCLGMNLDGAFSDYIQVPPESVFPIADSLALLDAAFVEPVAAAMSVLEIGLKPQMDGLVIGQGRIAQLTMDILQIHGFSHIQLVSAPTAGLKADFVIETRVDFDLESVLGMLNPNGICVLKCRRPTTVRFPAELIVQNSLQIKGANYIQFEKAVAFLESGALDLTPYIGSISPLDQFISKFNLDETKKVFCQPHRNPEAL